MPWGKLEKSCSYLKTRHANPSSSTDSFNAFMLVIFKRPERAFVLFLDIFADSELL